MDDTKSNVPLSDAPLSDAVTEILENLGVCKSIANASTNGLTPVRLRTTGFEIIADCDLNGHRLTDLLNQQISDYLEISNARLYRGEQLIEEVDRLKICKPEIMVAGIAGDSHEAPEKRIGSRRQLLIHETFVAIDRWIVKGHLHMTSNKTVKEFLHANRDYFPIADAEVIDATTPESRLKMPVAIVNRSRVSFMEITDPETVGNENTRSSIEDLLAANTI